MNDEPKAGQGLDPELLAAYIDHRLSPEQRAAVEAQLGTDPDSYDLLVVTMKAQDALEIDKVRHVRTVPFVPGEVARVPGGRWAIGGLVLAAAASVALFFWLQVGQLERNDSPQFDELIAAVGPQRYTEGRLTGGFGYFAAPSAVRGAQGASGREIALLSVVAKAEAAAKASPTVANLHALGVGQILIGHYGDALMTLGRAATLSGATAHLLSDLAVAYIEDGKARNSVQSLQAAVEAADRALEIDPSASIPVFNRALALEAMNRRDEALQAWSQFLSLEPSSPWSAEARLHVRDLEAPK